MGKQNLGGSFTFPGTSMTVERMGYGAMQLAGPGVYGPPKDHAAALAVLRAALEAGVNHIDTSDFYGPHVTNQIIREALHPYAKDLVIVTKIGARRTSNKAWLPALAEHEIVAGIEDNLRNLGLEAMDVVNLRVGGVHGPTDGSIGEPLQVLVKLQQQGKIKHLGLSNVSPAQYAEGTAIAKFVCIQNMYNVAHREDDGFIEQLAQDGVAYVPFFPLGGFSPLQSGELDAVAKEVEATPMQVALAWLMHRSANVLLIPGTSSVGHLEENLAAASLQLSAEMVSRLDAIGQAKATAS